MERRYGLSELLLVASDEHGSIDDGFVTSALADAEDEINGYVQVVKALPLPLPTPPILTRLECTIAMYRMSPDVGRGYTDAKRQNFEDAIQTCVRISRGELKLGETAEAPSETGTPVFSSEKPRFNRRDMRRIF
jgi:phage gp36-like protein